MQLVKKNIFERKNRKVSLQISINKMGFNNILLAAELIGFFFINAIQATVILAKIKCEDIVTFYSFHKVMGSLLSSFIFISKTRMKIRYRQNLLPYCGTLREEF